MPEAHVLDIERDPTTGNITKRVTESLGENPGDVVRTTTTYTPDGKKETEVRETFHRPPDDPRARSNLIERRTTSYGPDGQPLKEATEYFGDGVNETPTLKIVKEWAVDPNADPQRMYLKFFRLYRWDPTPAPGSWEETHSVEHNPDGTVRNVNP